MLQLQTIRLNLDMHPVLQLVPSFFQKSNIYLFHCFIQEHGVPPDPEMFGVILGSGTPSR